MNNKLITKDTIRRVIEQYKRYKLSLGEEYVIESISTEIADELRRRFIIEPVRTYPQTKQPSKENASDN